MWFKRHAHFIALAFSLLCASFFFVLQVKDHLGLRTQLQDVGHMEQAIWSVAQGDLAMTVTHPGLTAHSRLREHANLIFYFLAPLYIVFPTPLLLLGLSCLAFGTGGYLFFLLARRVTGDALLGLAMGAIFLAHPMIQDAVLFDFHPVVLAIALVPLVLLLAETKHWRWYWVALAALLLLKEDMPWLVLSLSPFIFVRYGRLIGSATALVSLLYWAFLRLVLPSFTGLSVASYNWYRFGVAGRNPEEVVTRLLMDPLLIAEIIDTPAKLSYLAVLFFQGGYLFVLAPLLALAAVPNAAQNVLVATDWQVQVTGTYYSAVVMTVLLSAVVYGFIRAHSRHPRLARGVFVFFVVQVAAQSIVLTPAPYGLLSHWKDFGQYVDYRTFREYKDLIPPTASLAVQNNLGAHMAGRSELYSARDYAYFEPDYVFIHLSDPTWRFQRLFFERDAYHLLFGSMDIFEELFADERYGLIAYGEAFYLFEGGASRENNDDGLAAARGDFALYQREARRQPPLPAYERRLEKFVLRFIN